MTSEHTTTNTWGALFWVVGFVFIGCSNQSDIPMPPQILEEITDEDLQAFVREMYDRATLNLDSGLMRGRLAMTYDVNSFREAAIETYEQASLIDNSNAEWPYLQALVYLELGDTEAALVSMEMSLARDPTYLPAKLYRGQFLLDLGLYADAEQEYLEVLELATNMPYEVSAKAGLARSYVATSRFPEAIEILEPLVRKHEQPFLTRILARTYRAAGMTRKSRELLPGEEEPQALEWPDPRADRPKPYLRGFSTRLVLAEEFITKGRVTEALSILERLNDLRPDDISVLNNLGIAYKLAGRYDKSIEVLLHGLSVVDNDHLLHFNLAVNFEELGQISDSLDHYRKAISANAGLLPAYERIANLLIKQNKFADAVDVLRNSLIHSEVSADTYYLIGLGEGMQGNWKQSVEDFQRAVELDPNNAGIYLKLALSFAELGEFQNARGAIAAARQLDENMSAIGETKQLIDEMASSFSQ